MTEVWQDIRGYEGKYQVSNLGRVRRAQYYIERKTRIGTICKVLQKAHLMRPWVDKDGYLIVNLYNRNLRRTTHFRVHRLVADAFIPHKNNKTVVNHKNGNKRDNMVTNLEWATQEENTWHATFVLKRKGRKGRHVKRISENGRFVNTYESLSAAGRSVGCSQQAIFDAIKKRRICKGYYWLYAD